MFYYARSDTHYLLYVYDNLRNEILSSTQPDMSGHDLMRLILDKSKETSLRRHESFAYDTKTGQGPFGWFNMLIRQSAGKFSREQFAVFRAIHQWRDELARKEDESPLFVMNNATVFDIARRLPPDPKALHGLLDSGSFLAKRDVSTLFKIITKAIQQGANGPSVAEVIRGNAPATMGIGEVSRSVVPQLKDRGKDTIDTNDLVSHSSRLWGDVPVSSRWDSQRQSSVPKQSQFELPWAQFVQSARLAEDAIPEQSEDVIMLENKAAEASTRIPTEATNGDSMPDDGEFTLKAGIKRKALEFDSSSESDEEPQLENEAAEPAGPELKTTPGSEEEIAVPNEDDSEQEKKARKAKKKALRLARKAEKRQQKDRERAEKRAKNQDSAFTSKDRAEESDEPFDYNKAKSVLKADNAASKNVGGSRKAKFNPYALTAEGPKPARRLHGERTGKSATFAR